MIALVSSTIFPLPATKDTLYRQTVPPQERLAQTVKTVDSLVKQGFEDIFIFDNSGFNWELDDEILLKPANVIKFTSYQFVNKSISEIYMLLSGLPALPDNEPIFKISGRYQLTQVIETNQMEDYDFLGQICDKSNSITTRGYYVKNKKVLEEILLGALNYIYAYSHMVVGPRSLIQVIQNAFFLNQNNNFFDPTISIEQGMYVALKKFKVKPIEKLHIKGLMAGPFTTNQQIDD